MLGITADAVRSRARAGLDRLSDAPGLTEEQRGDLADYLLGQQSVSKREDVRALLAASADARDWANDVADELALAWPSVVLPEVPEDGPSESAAADLGAPEDSGDQGEDADDLEGPFVADDASAPLGRPVPAPRPRPRAQAPPPVTASPPGESPPTQSSQAGGAKRNGGRAIVLAALLIWLFSMNGEDESGETTATTTPTPAASATPQPAAAIDLKSTTGDKAVGQLVLFVDAKSAITFQIAAENVPQSKKSEAYAVWLIGGDKPHRLGFTPPVGKDGLLATSGPQDADAKDFPQWFAQAKHVVVSRETTGDATKPGQIILRGKIDLGSAPGAGGSG